VKLTRHSAHVRGPDVSQLFQFARRHADERQKLAEVAVVADPRFRRR